MLHSSIDSNMSIFLMKLTWCLHGYLYPTSKFTRNDKDGKKTSGKYTIKDSQESFMFLAQNMQELDNHLQFLQKRGDRVQPFIVAVGDVKFEMPEYNYFLYLDQHLLPFTDFQRVFDVCFKSFHLFNLEFPSASAQFWMFIQIYFYNMKCGNSKKCSKALNLLSDLNHKYN